LIRSTNLVDNDFNWSSANYDGGAGGSWCEPGASFSMDAKIEGGESKIDAGDIGARANVASSADAILNQSAFDQNITQGANIQFNSITIQAAHGDVNDATQASLAYRPARQQPRGSFFQSFHFSRCSRRKNCGRPRLYGHGRGGSHGVSELR
jgi:hypothetical protein